MRRVLATWEGAFLIESVRDAKRYPVPAGEARAEIEVLNSRFIATAAPVSSVKEAREFIARVKHEFADATHNVPAYIVGYGASVIAHCHDDGEPAGTAGRPALAVLRGSGLGDVAVVVTRYFGGTKLGTGGLVRAYGDAVRAVLQVVVRAERVATHTVFISMPYAYYERVRQTVSAHNGRILEEDFGQEVSMTAQFAVDLVPGFQSALSDLSNGTLQAEILGTEDGIVLPA
jgi:uncharacterized YigZ family protein